MCSNRVKRSVQLKAIETLFEFSTKASGVEWCFVNKVANVRQLAIKLSPSGDMAPVVHDNGQGL